jgi:hypothetical protein
MMAYDNAPFHVQEHAAQLDGHAVWGSRGPTEYLIIRQVFAGYTKSTEMEGGSSAWMCLGTELEKRSEAFMDLMVGLRGFVCFVCN